MGGKKLFFEESDGIKSVRGLGEIGFSIRN